MPMISPAALTDFVSAMFHDAGVPQDDARVVGESLVGANLRGHDSHGVMRVPQYVGFIEGGDYKTGVDLLVVNETLAVCVCDAQWGFGQIQAHRLLDRIIPKAKSLGLSAGSLRNSGHIG